MLKTPLQGDPCVTSGWRIATTAVVVVLTTVLVVVAGVVQGADPDKPPARSLSELRWLGVTRQDQPQACGLAAWQTWVSALGVPADRVKRVLSSPGDHADEPVSLLELYHLTGAADVPVLPFRFSPTGLREYLASEQRPLLLHLAAGAGHFVVVSAPADDGTVQIADPAAGWRSMSVDDLLSVTSGSALVAANDWTAKAGEEWTRGLARARELSRAFQRLIPADELATELGAEVTARLYQEVMPDTQPSGDVVPVVRSLWSLPQASLVASTSWGGREGPGAEIFTAFPADPGPRSDGGGKCAGINLSWAARGSSDSTRSLVRVGCHWSEGSPSPTAWEFGLWEEVNSDPVRQHLGLVFSESNRGGRTGGEGVQALLLAGGADIVLTPSLVIGGEVGLTVEGDGRVGITSAANCTWLLPEGHAWRLRLSWLAGQGVILGMSYRHQWRGSRGE